MQIQEINIKQIKPYEKNPRRNDKSIPFVAESIDKFGFKVPIILDSNYVIAAGHTRYKAALYLGLENVPCIIADDLTDEQIKAFRLADNKCADYSEWDMALVEEELEMLNEIFDMSALGFDFYENSFDIDDFFNPVEQTEKNTEETPKSVCCPFCGKEFVV